MTQEERKALADHWSDLPRLIFEAVGAASMCWDPRPSHEVFDTGQATKVAEDLLAEIRRLASAAPAAQATGEWVMVPREPTQDHFKAGVRAFQSGFNGTDNLSDWRAFWQTMLSAAPAAPVQLEPVAWPDGLLERVKAAEQRIADNHAPRRIPADPTDVDLVLAEVRRLIEGKEPPFWLAHPSPVQLEQPTPLTDEQIDKIDSTILRNEFNDYVRAFARAIELAHGIGTTADTKGRGV